MVQPEDMWSVLTTFSDEVVQAALDKCNELGLDPNRGEIPLDESIINLKNSVALLRESVRDRKLIQLPISIQNAIHKELITISQNITGLTSGTDTVVNLTAAIERLLALIWQNRIAQLSDETVIYKEAENRLKAIEQEAHNILKELRAGLKQRKSLDDLLILVTDSVESSKLHASSIKKLFEDSGTHVKATESAVTSANSAVSATEKIKSQCGELLTAIEGVKKQTDIRDKEIDAYRKSIFDLEEKAIGLAQKFSQLFDESTLQRTDMSSQLEKLQLRAESLLPGATSAGLAAAFRSRKEAISRAKGRWIVGFVGSIVALSLAVGFIIYDSQTSSGTTEWWKHLLERIPLTFPLVWAGWFFGRNYGHMMRLEEVYAFKEAISSSFEGYKQQMAEVSGSEGLRQFCSEVIDIVAVSPLGVFERKSSDETPFHAAWERITGRKKTKTDRLVVKSPEN